MTANDYHSRPFYRDWYVHTTEHISPHQGNIKALAKYLLDPNYKGTVVEARPVTSRLYRLPKDMTLIENQSNNVINDLFGSDTQGYFDLFENNILDLNKPGSKLALYYPTRIDNDWQWNCLSWVRFVKPWLFLGIPGKQLEARPAKKLEIKEILISTTDLPKS